MSEDAKKQEDFENTSFSKVERQLKEANPEAFQGIPKEKQQQLIKDLEVTLRKTHIGPLPDPETLAQYDQIIPNGGERIMRMAEKQLDHRMESEKKKTEREKSLNNSEILQSKRGQWMAFVLVTSALIFSGFLIFRGELLAGGISFVALGFLMGIAKIADVFIQGKKLKTK